MSSKVTLPPESEDEGESAGDRKELKCITVSTSSSNKSVFALLTNNSCIRYKKDLFETRKDHLVQFVSEDCRFSTEVSKKLENEELVNFEALLSINPQKGHCIVFEINNSILRA